MLTSLFNVFNDVIISGSHDNCVGILFEGNWSFMNGVHYFVTRSISGYVHIFVCVYLFYEKPRDQVNLDETTKKIQFYNQRQDLDDTLSDITEDSNNKSDSDNISDNDNRELSTLIMRRKQSQEGTSAMLELIE